MYRVFYELSQFCQMFQDSLPIIALGIINLL